MVKRRWAWLTGCAAMGLLYLFENNTATRISLIVSVMLPLMGRLAVPLAAKRVTVRLRAPQDTLKHTDFRAVCAIQGPLQLINCHITLLCRNLLTGEETRITSPARGKALGCTLRTAHCGLLVLNASVTLQDILGLWNARRLHAQPVSVWVTPQMRPLDITLSDTGGDRYPEAVSNPMPGTDTGDPFAVRAYIPGDPVRLIHWKLSQKTDTLMLRELRQPADHQVLLVFDASCPAGEAPPSPAVMNVMAEFMLSLSKSLLEASIPHTVCWHPCGQPLPACHPIMDDADFARLMSAFFSDAPAREAPVLPDDSAAGYTHVALIAAGSRHADPLRGRGLRLTVFSGDDCLHRSQVMLYDR